MPVYYFDTSALVKRYHVEPGSETVDQLFAEPEAAFLIANITIAELTSALVRKLQEGLMTRPVLDHVLSAFAQDLLTDFWIIDLERVHVLHSRELILKHHLRTLDGLHLAVLLALRELSPTLVCSDQKLIEAAEKEQIQIIDPEA